MKILRVLFKLNLPQGFSGLLGFVLLSLLCVNIDTVTTVIYSNIQ
jgi:hypothetical protein